MIGALILFLVPLVLFVAAFLYETYLSFVRLKNPKAGRTGYVNATWEVTHTLLVFTVVMLLMLFSSSLEKLADVMFLSTFLAATALAIRIACYLYIFYIRTSKRTNWIDWTFAISHVAAAGLLVVTVLRALWFIYKEKPEVNSQFIPAFLPGLALVLALCAVPLMSLYFAKKK